MSFDKKFDLTAGVYFNFYNIYIYKATPLPGQRKPDMLRPGIMHHRDIVIQLPPCMK